jgi:GTP-binding protein HflX
LFATLDPTLRRLDLQGGSHVVLADTVGFVRDLPHDLVAAFRSTLSETRDADLLLHVVDASRDDRDTCIEQVENVLRQIGAHECPVLMVYNKSDLINRQPIIERDESGKPVRVWLSAQTGGGIELLKEALAEIFRDLRVQGWVLLEPHEAALRARLYEMKVVMQETHDDQGRSLMQLSINTKDLKEVGLEQRFSHEKDRVALLQQAV